MSHYIGTKSRLVGLISAGICASVLLFGNPLLAYVPKLLLGLVLIYLTLGIAMNLALDRWPELPTADRGILLLVLLSLIWLGFVEGIVIGIIAGLAVFAFNYARLGAVRASEQTAMRARCCDRRRNAGSWPIVARPSGGPSPGLSVLQLGHQVLQRVSAD